MLTSVPRSYENLLTFNTNKKPQAVKLLILCSKKPKTNYAAHRWPIKGIKKAIITRKVCQTFYLVYGKVACEESFKNGQTLTKCTFPKALTLSTKTRA